MASIRAPGCFRAAQVPLDSVQTHDPHAMLGRRSVWLQPHQHLAYLPNELGMLISVGLSSGKSQGGVIPPRLRAGNVDDLINGLGQIVADSEPAHRVREFLLAGRNPDDVYHRINAPAIFDQVGLNHWHRVRELREALEAMLLEPETVERLKRIARQLCQLRHPQLYKQAAEPLC
ncbi:hypothetical protein BKA62DRAFT_713164 [Auriculariales sp. MPI-PUGE-AT-0066]|nr:hypothetical protein BKA62DRAFT_713164 [Auriculariales sp. MPI-PUGE-AT-0066]